MPLCNEIFFYDNENGFVEVGRYRSGEMILRANAPAWLDELRVRYDERLNDISRDKEDEGAVSMYSTFLNCNNGSIV